MINVEVVRPRFLPCHPKPRPDELLSSWIVRTASANRIGLGASLGTRDPHWTYKDLDVNLPDSALEHLSRSTGISVDCIRGLSLESYKGALFKTSPPNAALPHWILPIRTKLQSLQFCPQCLLEDKYYRKVWRMAFVAFCTKHECRLIDRCRGCAQPVSYHSEATSGWDSHLEFILRCPYCAISYRRSKAEPVLPSNEAFEFQTRLESVLEQRHMTLNGRLLPAPEFFEGLRFLAGLLLRRPKGLALRKAVLGKEYDLEADRSTHARLEFLSNADRATVMGCLAIIVDNWPSNFLNCYGRAHLTSEDMKLAKLRRNGPRWLRDLMHSLIGAPRRPYSAEFRDKIINLIGSGRTISSLAREFAVAQWTISRWLTRAKCDAGSDRRHLAA